MNIIGPDALVFGVEDVAQATGFLTDFGLTGQGEKDQGGLFSALDGTGVIIRHKDDPALPPDLGTGNQVRKMTYGVTDQVVLDEVAEELSKDREVRLLEDGSIESEDDMGFTLGFQVTVRQALALPGEVCNAPGAPSRPENRLGVQRDADIRPRTLSHFALFVPDVTMAEAFYMDRLGFRCNDRLGGGPFLRPAGTREHHTMFLIQGPPQLKGIEHCAFHLGGPGEVMEAGSRFVKKGYESFWGPGRHGLGSNWFWYFQAPLGCRFEYDADMDRHDDGWVPREWPLHADNAQAYLLEMKEKNWAPFDGPKPRG